MVYIVLGGWDYEGCDIGSTQIFATEGEAREYGQSLVLVGGFHFYDLVVREVPPTTR